MSSNANENDDEGLDLQNETNDLLLMLIESSALQQRSLEKIHFWVRYLGLVVLLGGIATLIVILAAL